MHFFSSIQHGRWLAFVVVLAVAIGLLAVARVTSSRRR